jgi:hypothetical protein
MATQRKPEYVRQVWIAHFLERALLPFCEVRSVDAANRDMANISTRMMALGRFVKPGTSDILVWQEPRLFMGIEVKHEGKETDAQRAFAVIMQRVGFHVARECRSMADVLTGLRAAGMRLHANAENLAVEYEERMQAGLRELASKAKPRAASKPYVPRPTRTQIARVRATGIWGRT